MLQEQADRAYKKAQKQIKTYHFDTKGLKPRPDLLAYVESVLASPIEEIAEFDQELYLQYLREGHGRHKAARAAGGDPKVIKRRLRFDAVLREEVELAEEEASETIEDRLWQLATKDERWAMELWLKKRYKGRWGDEPTVVKHEGTVTHELSSGPLLEQIAQLQTNLQERKALMSGDIIDAELVEDE